MLAHPNIALWLRDVNGVLTDVSGKGHTLTKYGNPTQGQAGQFGEAWQYSTNTGYHEVTDAADLRYQYPFYAVSFYPTQDTHYYARILSKDDATSAPKRQIFMGYQGTVDATYTLNVIWGVPNGTVVTTPINSAPINSMHRFVGWLEPGYAKCILNGVVYSVAGTIPDLTGTTENILISTFRNASNQNFIGKIDNFMLGKFTTIEDMWRIYNMQHPLTKV